MRRFARIGLFVAGMLVGGAVTAQGQTRDATIEAQFGIGFTVVDREGYADVAGLSDWNQTAFTIRGRALFVPIGDARLGVEFGHEYHWYYAFRFLNNTLTRDVTSTNLNAVIRLPTKSRLVVDVGAGFHFFSDFTTFGVLGSVGYQVPLGEKVSLIPSARVDMVFDSYAMMMPLTGNVTLSIKFP
jgi:hypothetical protein